MKPIILPAPDVLATLAGTKTHLCRPVKLPKGYETFEVYGAHFDGERVNLSCDPGPNQQVVSPFGPVGSRLYGRETWAPADNWDKGYDLDDPALVGYRADGQVWNCETPDDKWLFDGWKHFAPWFAKSGGKWRSSATMPMWASRITLEVTALSVFRVQDITEELARREGVSPDAEPCDHPRLSCKEAGCIGREWAGHRANFAQAWIDAHGPESWSRNDWVWGVGYKLLNTKDAK